MLVLKEVGAWNVHRLTIVYMKLLLTRLMQSEGQQLNSNNEIALYSWSSIFKYWTESSSVFNVLNVQNVFNKKYFIEVFCKKFGRRSLPRVSPGYLVPIETGNKKFNVFLKTTVHEVITRLRGPTT